MVNDDILKKIKAGKDLTDEEIESLPDGKLKEDLKKRKVLTARIKQSVAKESDKDRRKDTRRKILAGAAVLDEASRKAGYKKELYELLNSFLTKPDDRALFGLTVPTKKEAEKTQGNTEKKE